MLSFWKLSYDLLTAQRNKPSYNPEGEEDPVGKIVVITGANSGIGKVASYKMFCRGAIVVMACRDIEKAKLVCDEIHAKFENMDSNSKIKGELVLLELDLGDLASIRKCAQEIQEKYDHIDILINNAGVMYADGKMHKTKDGFEANMGINYLGHFLFTLLLVDLVKKKTPSRIVFTTSSTMLIAKLDIDDLQLEKKGDFGPKHHGPYGNSKLAILYFTNSLGNKLKGTGVTTYALCTGFVQTDLFRHDGHGCIRRAFRNFGFKFSMPEEEGADTILYCALSKNCSQETGLMYRFGSVWEKPMSKLNDLKQQKLWEKSKELVGIKYI